MSTFNVYPWSVELCSFPVRQTCLGASHNFAGFRRGVSWNSGAVMGVTDEDVVSINY
jgi:hypothetical protein